MLGILALSAALVAAWFGYFSARTFVRDRLRFVDGVHSLKAPILAGIVACGVALPVAWLLPLVGSGTALLFGVAVALGVRSGSRDILHHREISAG